MKVNLKVSLEVSTIKALFHQHWTLDRTKMYVTFASFKMYKGHINIEEKICDHISKSGKFLCEAPLKSVKPVFKHSTWLSIRSSAEKVISSESPPSIISKSEQLLELLIFIGPNATETAVSTYEAMKRGSQWGRGWLQTWMSGNKAFLSGKLDAFCARLEQDVPRYVPTFSPALPHTCQWLKLDLQSRG